MLQVWEKAEEDEVSPQIVNQARLRLSVTLARCSGGWQRVGDGVSKQLTLMRMDMMMVLRVIRGISREEERRRPVCGHTFSFVVVYSRKERKEKKRPDERLGQKVNSLVNAGGWD